MKKLKTDVAVIGAGTAGIVAFNTASKHTNNIILIEGGQYGTTCARVGCMPSKLMIAAADAAHMVEKAPGFGVFPGSNAHIDGVKVMERVRNERDRFVGSVLDKMESLPDANKLRGYAKFLDDHTLMVGDHTTVEAGSIVIATGSTPFVPPMFRELGDRLVVSDDVFYWKDLPGSVVVFGAGIIGLEIGQALHRLGVRIRMFGKGGHIGPIKHPEIRDYAARIFADEFNLNADGEILSIGRNEEGVEVRFKDLDGTERTETFDYLLAATGRRHNVTKLGLENTSLELDERGIPFFNRFTLRCGESSIFIAGDADEDVPILHEAADEGYIAGENAALFPDIMAGKRKTPMSVVFSDPQIATAGCGYNELIDMKEMIFVTGRVSFENQGRSKIMQKNKGMLHIYAEYGSGLLLGAEMFGPSAEHIGHLLAWAREKKMTVSEMLEMPYYHPTIEEGLRTALRNANEKLHRGPALAEDSIECGPGI